MPFHMIDFTCSCNPASPVLPSHQGDEIAPPGMTAQTRRSFSGLMTLRYAVIRPSVIWTVSTE